MNRNCLKIRLYPTKLQAATLCETLDTCRQIYNSLLLDRKVQYETTGVSVGRYDQQAYLPVWKLAQSSAGDLAHPELTSVYSQVLQDVVHRVDLAFRAFFDRVKRGETPGFPRFKKDSYDSFTYTQAASFRVAEDAIQFSKIGTIKAVLHRKPWGLIKNCTIRRQNGKWFACICQEIAPEPLPFSEETIGIDVGLNRFAALSDGTFIPNPRFFKQDQKALAKAQRKLERQKSGSFQRRKAKKVISRIHEKIRNRRHNFLHQTARSLVNRYSMIAVEKLSVKNMSARPHPKTDEVTGEYLPNEASRKAGLNKSILDAAWSQFRLHLKQKAESAVREIIEVNPAHTSQDCSNCGFRVPKTLKERWHHCPTCGASLDRDTNSAIIIEQKALGQQCFSAIAV